MGRKMSIEERVKYIQNEIKVGLQATYNAVIELQKIEKEESWVDLKGCKKYTFKMFVTRHFNISLYMFRTLEDLITKYNKKDFDTFGPKILQKVESTKNPEKTLQELREIVKKKKVISIDLLNQIIRLNKKYKTKKKNFIAGKKEVVKWLDNETKMWLKEGWVTIHQANKIREEYKLRPESLDHRKRKIA